MAMSKGKATKMPDLAKQTLREVVRTAIGASKRRPTEAEERLDKLVRSSAVKQFGLIRDDG